VTLSAGWNNNQMSEAFSGTIDFLYVRVAIHADFSSGSFDCAIRIHYGGNYYAKRFALNSNTGINTYPIQETFIVPVFSSINTTVYVDVYSGASLQYDGWLWVYSGTVSHSHTISQHNVNSGTGNISSSNRTPLVTGKTDLHNHNVSIGDGASESGSVNASEVDIYLDFWEAITNNETAGSDVVVEMADTGNIIATDVVYFDGRVSGNAEWATVASVVTNTSITISTLATNKSAGDYVTWNNKHSILNTGKTLDTDVDITDSGTYPDAVGYWRVRVEPDNASADYVSIVKIRHHMDN